MSTTSAATTSEPPRTHARTGLVRIGVGLFLGTVAWGTLFSAGSAVLLPARIAEIAPDDKVRLLAVLTAAAALVGVFGNVVFGALSDRTRSRFGSRTPWIVGGAIAASLLMIPLASADSFLAILFWWCLAIGLLNAPTASWMAVLPDRVPVTRRATISALIGLGVLVGAAVGSIVGAVFLDDPGRGLLVVGAITVVLTLVAVAIAPDHPNLDVLTERARLRWRDYVAGIFTMPRNAPDFYWALFGRLALVLGYFMINGYQLYILTDYVGLGDDAAAKALGLNSLLFLGAAIIGTAVAGPASDRLQRRKAFVIGASALAMVAGAIPFFSATTAAMMGFAVVGGLAFGGYYSVDAALMSEVIPSDDSRARDLGILNMATTGGQALAPAASSALVAIGIGFAPVFVGSVVVCGVGALLVSPIRTVR